MDYSESGPATFAEVAMNVTLWIMQVLWGVFFALNGFGKALCYNQAAGTRRCIPSRFFSSASSLCLGFPGCRRAFSFSSASVSFWEALA